MYLEKGLLLCIKFADNFRQDTAIFLERGNSRLNQPQSQVDPSKGDSQTTHQQSNGEKSPSDPLLQRRRNQNAYVLQVDLYSLLWARILSFCT
jgi:hypothetical protein